MSDSNTTLKDATLDITIGTGTNLLSGGPLSYAEKALVDVFKSAGDDVAGIATKLGTPIQLLTVTGAKKKWGQTRY